MKLNELTYTEGSRHASYRRGRGHGSGNGKTAGKGHKGQNARSGGGVRLGFEGGQTPLSRRLPKRGFSNARFKKVYATVIPRNVRLSEAPSFGEPVLYYDRGSKGAESYNNLAEEFLKMQK